MITTDCSRLTDIYKVKERLESVHNFDYTHVIGCDANLLPKTIDSRFEVKFSTCGLYGLAALFGSLASIATVLIIKIALLLIAKLCPHRSPPPPQLLTRDMLN